MLAGILVLVVLGHWLEQRKPGVAITLVYSGMAAFALLCLYGYIVPALTS